MADREHAEPQTKEDKDQDQFIPEANDPGDAHRKGYSADPQEPPPQKAGTYRVKPEDQG